MTDPPRSTITLNTMIAILARYQALIAKAHARRPRAVTAPALRRHHAMRERLANRREREVRRAGWHGPLPL